MGTYIPGLNFPIYSGWGQYTPVIPKLYWDVYSQEQRLKQLCMNFDKVEHYLDYVAKLMNEWNIEFTDEIEAELADMWRQIHDGYIDAMNEWFQKDFYRELVAQVFFGLTLDGHFVAYIPESWDGIIFDTGQVYDLDTYGRLMLFYETDSNSDVWQDVYMVNDLQSILDNLDSRITANEHELNDPLDESEVDDD